MFRLDRIDDARLLDEPAQVPQDVHPASGLFDGAASDELTTATLAVGPGAAWALEYHPFTVVDDDAAPAAEQPEGSADIILATMKYATQSWMVRFVLSFGGDLEVKEPAELAAAVAERAGSGLANYS